MSEDEFSELLQHLVASARRAGLGEIPDRVLQDLRIDPGSSSGQVLRFPDALIAEIRLGSDPTIRGVVATLNDVAATESGRPIDGLRVELAPSDQIALNVESVDLGVAHDLSAIVERFELLRADLAESREEF